VADHVDCPRVEMLAVRAHIARKGFRMAARSMQENQ